jgi:hypothetical protein
MSDFYAKLEAFESFKEVTNSANFQAMPKNWIVIVSDIKGSTKAIDAGRYKEVNFVGAMAIIAMLNLVKEVEIPFVFGGDGATILIPESYKERAREVLLATRIHARKVFDIELRVGMVDVDTLYAKGQVIDITKLAVSSDYHQAILRGGGLSYAEDLIKDDMNPVYQLYEESGCIYEADFSGLECRWEDIPSPKSETLSMLILVRDKSDIELYQAIMQKMDESFGKGEERHPIKPGKLKLSFNPKKLLIEASLFGFNLLTQLPHLIREMIENGIANYLIQKNKHWKNYKNHVSQTTDVEKFDDMLRVIVASTQTEREAFESYLERVYKDKKIYYGIHVTDRALMTCLIFERHGKQVHFVDAADGGYAMAAKQFKAQMQLDQ